MTNRLRATAQLHVRIPPEEKLELQAEARRHQVSMSALVRISVIAARDARERETLLREIYPHGTGERPSWT